ncbi:Uncharacterised protein [Mycobacterium tuberculosis]|nr:Uncharacterised protein [Mycobacterium tuberculosis]CKO68892.1 Uncharacterised protein [Mycobacterium tuberculosis]CKQ56705.1 Uncharacterised protein [Mycobacterium tuberculosis]CKQ90345.1 Uncharacterised protein [Mycobacterium tuberculosis]CKR40150.1 Uncharacterised protein [Mycobacterium tuberculosis]
MFGVVGPKFDTSGARQRTALAADLGASHVGQHRLSVGGGEKLDDVRRCERFDDPLPQSGRHARADEQPHRMVAVQHERRIVDHVTQHGPCVGDDGDAVLAYLGHEPVRAQAAGQCDTGSAHDRAAQADQQCGLMVQRRQTVHRVSAAEGRRRGGPEGRHRPAVVGDLLGHQVAVGRTERDERQIPRQSGIRSIPRRQLDGVRVDFFHVDDLALFKCVGRQIQITRFTTTQHQHLSGQLARSIQIGRVGQDLGHSPEPDRRGQVGVWPHHHGNRSQPRQRGDGDQRAGPSLHQHADTVTLPHPDRDEATNDIVDPPVYRLIGVHAPVEQQEFTLRGIVCLFVDDAAQRDPGVVVELTQPG